MEVIPVIDLKDGAVVHARMGIRSAYTPIETPLSPTSRPTDVARGLLSIFPFKKFYVADLDAIENKGNNHEVLKRLSVEFPELVFWVDAGIADVHQAERWLGRPVLAVNAAMLWHALRAHDIQDRPSGLGSILRIH